MDDRVDIVGGEATGRYKPIVAAIHWLSAALIIWQFYLGFTFGDFPKGSPERTEMFMLHKTVGVALLVLAVLRILVRLMNPPPAYPASMAGWERALSSWTHRLFYFLLFALPLTGLMLVSKGGATTEILGGISVPTIPAPDLGEVHEPLAFAMIGLFVLHVGGALKHLLIDRDASAGRMPPFGR